MIRAFRACLRRPDLRRVVGVVALLAFALVVLLGASHAGGQGDAAHDHCDVCVAAAAVATPDAFVTPALVDHLAFVRAAAPPGSERVIAAAPRRSHAPRGPPSLA